VARTAQGLRRLTSVFGAIPLSARISKKKHSSISIEHLPQAGGLKAALGQGTQEGLCREEKKSENTVV